VACERIIATSSTVTDVILNFLALLFIIDLDEAVMNAKLLHPFGMMGGKVTPVLKVVWTESTSSTASTNTIGVQESRMIRHRFGAALAQRMALLTALPLFQFTCEAMMEVRQDVARDCVAALMVAHAVGWAVAMLLLCSLELLAPRLLALLQQRVGLVVVLILLFHVRYFSAPGIAQSYDETAPIELVRQAALQGFAMTFFIGALVGNACRLDASEWNGTIAVVFCIIAAHFDIRFHVTGIVENKLLNIAFAELVGYDVASDTTGMYPRPHAAEGWATYASTAAFIAVALAIGAFVSMVYGALQLRAPLVAMGLLGTIVAVAAAGVPNVIFYWQDMGGLCTPADWAALPTNATECTATEFNGLNAYFGSLAIIMGLLISIGFVAHAWRRLGRSEAAGSTGANADHGGGDPIQREGVHSLSPPSREESSKAPGRQESSEALRARVQRLEEIVARLGKREGLDAGVDHFAGRQVSRQVAHGAPQQMQSMEA